MGEGAWPLARPVTVGAQCEGPSGRCVRLPVEGTAPDHWQAGRAASRFPRLGAGAAAFSGRNRR